MKDQTKNAGTSKTGSSMTFMNKFVNPLMSLILRSPAHGLVSASMLLISYHGRKTGREYCLPVQYAQAGKDIYIVPGMPERKTWWRNLKDPLPVELRLRGQSVSGTAVLVSPESAADAVRAGLDAYIRRFPAFISIHHLPVDASGNLTAEGLRQAAGQCPLICVHTGQP